jgi:glucosamine kinase
MQLIADSGSTKTSWRLVKSENEIIEASTIGYNPHYFDTEKMAESLQDLLVPQLGVAATEVSQIYFYGAGCSTQNSNAVVEKAFNNVFSNANIYVDHDLLGAARALCGKSAGIACILGTGSNSCAFDGKEITDNVSSLGFMLGDEGSGASLGRRLVKSFFYI